MVADPSEIQKAIEKYYGTESESVSDILTELGSDQEIENEVTARDGDTRRCGVVLPTKRRSCGL